MAGPASAMIFAAGLGTRMGALTRDRPKPLIRVGEATLLDHALAILRGAGIGRIVVNAHAHAGQVEAHLAEVAPEAAVSFESVLLETGGGLKAALPLLAPGPVLTLNADMVWRGPNPAAALAAAWDGARMGALLALVPRAAALGHAGAGDFRLGPDGRLARRGGAATAPFVYAGAQVIDPAALEDFEPGAFSLNRVWDALLAEGRLYGLVWPGRWVDVGRPEGIALAEAELAR
ncbi:nucleotidyltransferase family protein [Amaricoccus sp.]|uniref:nucleotidyltransferase family protein n=1 Tax=Amaricoccus sp. TaxID=1872485 RepID=UPI001B6AEC3D|nr:nucleotidyltransferase family protein [Amaricoccus sp.]MBP7001394.1 nucleotidyltransferase family protein [Amaricoccus sp.]